LWFLKICILCLSATILFGCAKAQVVPTKAPSEGLPKPDHIAVYDFAVTSKDIQLDRGVGTKMLRDADSTSQTEEKVRVGQAVAEALSKKLESELQAKGIKAYRASHAPSASSTTLSIKGQFRQIDQGNRTLRTVVGFGLGGSKLGTSIQVYQGKGNEAKLVAESETITESSLKPGIGVLFPVGAAAGTVATAAAVSGTSTVPMEKIFVTVEANAKRTAEAIAKRIIKYYKRHGWLT